MPGGKIVAAFKGGSADIPSSANRVEGYTADLLKYPGIKLTADPELMPGDCRAKSRFGMIDARVFTKLQNVARSLK